MIRSKKSAILTLRVCITVAAGILLSTAATPENLRPLAVAVWAVYAASLAGLFILPERSFSHRFFNPAFIASELALLGGVLAFIRTNGLVFYPLFLLTVLLSLLSRRLAHALLLGSAAAAAHIFIVGVLSGEQPIYALISDSRLMLQAVILMGVSGVIGYLMEESNRRESTAHLLDSALQISALLADSPDLESIFERLTQVLTRTFDAGRVAVIEVRPDSPRGRVVAAIDRGKRVDPLTIQLERYPEIQTALEKRRPIIVGNPLQLVGLQAVPTDRLREASILVTPILVGSETRGVVFVRVEDQRHSFTSHQVTFCQLMATAAAHAIVQAERFAQIEEAARMDSLTGLNNLRSFHHLLDQEVGRASRGQRPLALLMIDVDYLKRVNDAYGHLAGDEVLRTIARALQGEVREIDIVARYGGEEFAVLLPDTDGRGALGAAERIRTRIEGSCHDEIDHPVTVSIGIASFPSDGATPRDLVHHADRALYFSKYRGRNRITLFDDLHRELGEDSVERALVEAFTSVSIERHFNHDDPRLDAVRQMLTPFRDSSEVAKNLDQVIRSLTEAMHARDSYTRDHLEEAAALSEIFLKHLPIAGEQRREIRIACTLHDIGKLGISQDILQKADFLTREEYEIVRRHPEIGARIIEPLRPFRAVVPYIRHHHERWDGKGYPDGLRGEEIPYGARVVGLVDAFHAMISLRPYHTRTKGLRYAREEIRRNAGTQFDPELALRFLAIIDENEKRIEPFVARDAGDEAPGTRAPLPLPGPRSNTSAAKSRRAAPGIARKDAARTTHL